VTDDHLVNVSLWIITAFVILFIYALMRLKALERRRWNRGKCPSCRKPWVKFSHDKDQGRGYCCESCQRFIWISFSGIEKPRKKR